jgi:hypothetical protein
MTEIRVEQQAASSMEPVTLALNQVGLPLLIQAISLLLKEDELAYYAQVVRADFDPAPARYLSRVSKILDVAARAVDEEAALYLRKTSGHA